MSRNVNEHNKLHKDTQRGSQEHDVSHMYEHIRTLSFEEQMEIGLELLYKHAPKTYAKYVEKAEDVIHTSYLISKLS